MDHKVLFFRDQHITSDQHVAFCRRFGELEVHPFVPSKPGYPEVMVLDARRELPGHREHLAQRRHLAPGAVARARCCGPSRCPTSAATRCSPTWRRPTTAWARPMRTMLDGLVAVHDFARVFGLGKSADELAELREKYPPAEHPVIRTHPVTGRKSIYVNVAFTSHIEGLRPDESAPAAARTSTGRRRCPSTSAGSTGRPTRSPSGTTGACSTTR